MIRIFLPILLLASVFAYGQKLPEPNTKFGKITPEELQVKVYSIDSNAPAVVLFDVGNTQIVGNDKGWLSMQFKHRKRIHVLNKNGYDYAEVTIPLYKDGNDETKLDNLKAVTYNLEGGKLVETKLEKSGIFKEQIDKNRSRVKFTFPAVKEGSVVEFEYTIISDFYFTLMPWEFQGSIPRLWSEYKFELPQFMDYIFLAQGYFPFHIKDQKNRRQSFYIRETKAAQRTETYTIDANVADNRWVMKDVPVLRREEFTSTLDNHIAKIEFQLAGYRDPLTPRRIMNDWPAAAKSLIEREDFGRLYLANNGWLNDDVKAAINGANDPVQKAKNIYTYVRDRFTCTDHSSLIPDQSLKTTVKNNKGSVSEINLLLVAMLRSAGFNAEPVVLSTRDNGYAHSIYPLMNRLNYVVCQAYIDTNLVYLDASYKMLGFGKMMYDCYNGTARTINEFAPHVEFLPESLMEQKVTHATIFNVDGKWQGNVKQVPGYYESFQLRNKVQSEGMDGVKKDVQKVFASNALLTSFQIDSLKELEKPLAIQYQMDMQTNGEDILYINPLLGEKVGDNPFKSAERNYPVEMPYTFNETFFATIQIPDGYELDEMPKGMRMKMNEEGDGQFEYLISRSGGTISMRVTMDMKRTFFVPEEYEMLREFFNRVVSKQSEQLVFKKKK